jgi:hypothetical protein
MQTENDSITLTFFTKQDDIYNLLGKSIEDDYFQELMKQENLTYISREIKDYLYLSYPEQGISFCFVNKILDCIFLYNEGAFKNKQYKEIIPYNITWKMLNKDIVSKFGDTIKKGGGNVPIFLNYPRLGIEFNFVGKAWHDVENPLSHINLFKKDLGEELKLNCNVCLKSIDSFDDALTCKNKCEFIYYCSKKCMDAHISYHLTYCN